MATSQAHAQKEQHGPIGRWFDMPYRAYPMPLKEPTAKEGPEATRSGILPQVKAVKFGCH